MLPGSHFFLHSAQDQLLAAIARELQALLDTLAQRENSLTPALPTRQ
jgi:hypothetical protein